MAHVTFPKPTRLARDVVKHERRLVRETAKRTETRKEQKAWSELSAKVCKRDGNVCRVCWGQTTKFGVGNPRFYGQAHHIVYRSAGGQDDMSNLIWTCGQCHDDEHQHRIRITGMETKLRVEAFDDVSGAWVNQS